MMTRSVMALGAVLVLGLLGYALAIRFTFSIARSRG